MFFFDPRPLVAFGGLMSVLMAVVLFSMRRSYPPSIRGLREWSLAPAACALVSALVCLRGVLPDAVAVVGANLLLYAAFVLYLCGSRRYFGLPRGALPWLLGAAPLAVMLYWTTAIDPHPGLRLVLFNLVLVAVFLAHVGLYLHQGVTGFARRFMCTVLVVQAVALVGRAASVAWGVAGSDAMSEPTLLQAAFITVYVFIVLSMAIGAALLATERLRTELVHLATYDPLTGALGRGALLDACERELARCRRHGAAMSLVLIDLDHFKDVNDAHGHQAGDRVLVDFVKRVSGLLRSTDGVGRYGGEEFLLMLPDTDLATAQQTAERIRRSVELAMDTVPPYTFSAGVACTHEGAPNESVLALIGRADEAMYRAKAAGRNRVNASAG